MKKKILSLCMVGALAATAVGGTLAYFTDTDENTNVFTVGNVDITLDEALVVKAGDTYKTVDGDRVIENEYELIYPGAVLPKDPTVHNEGNNDAYVRVQVTIANGMTLLPTFVTDDTLTDDLYTDAFKAMVGTLGAGWEITDSIDAAEAMENIWNGVTDAAFEITYTPRLAAATDTTPVFTEITIPASWTQDDARITAIQEVGFKMNIVAEAIQAETFDAATDAFAAYDAE